MLGIVIGTFEIPYLVQLYAGAIWGACRSVRPDDQIIFIAMKNCPIVYDLAKVGSKYCQMLPKCTLKKFRQI